MNSQPYRYVMALLTREGVPLGRPVELLDLDDEPVREWARFQHFLCRGDGVPPPVSVMPQWDGRRGEPFVEGLRVCCDGAGLAIPRGFFEPAARQYSRELVSAGVLEKGDVFRYVVTATPSRAPAIASGLNIEVIEEPEPWAFLAVSPEEMMEAPVVLVEEGYGMTGDIPVYIPRKVLEEAAVLTVREAEVETGGFLLGHLCREPGTGRAGLVVTAQIAATDTVAGEAHLTFTARTWSAVHQARAKRQDGCAIVGWWHSHPANQWCKPECSAEAREACPLKVSFFSEMDVNVHRTVFCQGYSVALVLTNTGDGVGHALYGWRDGLVQRRAFHVTGCRTPLPAFAARCAPSTGVPAGCVSEAET